MNRIDLIKKLREVIYDNTDAPAEELIKLGNALIAVGEALKNISPQEARRTIQIVALLEGYDEKLAEKLIKASPETRVD